jgi:hypothetical protein
VVTTALSHRAGPTGAPPVPLPPSADLHTIWSALFGELAGEAHDDAMRLSVLDLVQDQTATLRDRLGAADRLRLDAHLQGVWELEQAIVASPACAEPDAAPDATTFCERHDAMAAMLAYAMTCDITRVASLFVVGPAADTVLVEAGVAAPHHVVSHATDEQPGAQQHHEGVVFLMQRLADFLARFDAAPDAAGTTLLDSAIVLATTEVTRGWTHEYERQPCILAGGGRGWLRQPGTHLQAIAPADPNDPAQGPSARNVCDVMLTCLRAFDPDAQAFGSGVTQSTAVIDEILA